MFKVGDKVKVLGGYETYGAKTGHIGTVVEEGFGGCLVESKEDWETPLHGKHRIFMGKDNLELIKDEPKNVIRRNSGFIDDALILELNADNTITGLTSYTHNNVSLSLHNLTVNDLIFLHQLIDARLTSIATAKPEEE
jgi:hypothetical protein